MPAPRTPGAPYRAKVDPDSQVAADTATPETLTVEPTIGQRIVVNVLLIGWTIACGVFLLTSGLKGRGDEAALASLGILAAIVLWWSFSRLRVELTGDTFYAVGNWGRPQTGRAAEFIGYTSDGEFGFTLLRASDLAVIRIPIVDGWRSRSEKLITEWLDQRLVYAHHYHAKAIEAGSHLSEQRTLFVLDRARQQGDEHAEDASDLELAQAARAAWRFRYRKALPRLHELLLDLPDGCLATQYIVEALRRLGTAESVVVLHKALAHEHSVAHQLARALTELATPQHRPLLEALTQGKDKRVKRIAKRALKRLGKSPTPETKA